MRAEAVQALSRRDPWEIVPMLIGLLQDPQLDPDPILFRYSVTPVAWDSVTAPGVVYVRAPGYDVLRMYTVGMPAGALAGSMTATSLSNLANRVSQQCAQQVSDLTLLIDQIRAQSSSYVLAACEHVRQVELANEQVMKVLRGATGRSLGNDREKWRKWWSEERGYGYKAPPTPSRDDLSSGEDKTIYFSTVNFECFAAGTPVLTLAGRVPIERVSVGDQVLSQDARSGAISYHPVAAVTRSAPPRSSKLSSVRTSSWRHRYTAFGGRHTAG